MFKNNNGTLGYIGMTGTANGGLQRWTADTNTVYTIWDSGNDGSGSGLDADLLDGKHASEFQPAGNYLTAESDTLQTITNRGATTTKGITVNTLSATSTNSTQSVEVSNTKVRLADSGNGFDLQYNKTYKALEFVFN